MAKFADRVVETTQTTGTGTLDLDGAQTGFRAFSDELTTGRAVYYVIEDDPASPTEYEYGIGTWTSGSPNTLSRDTVEGSSNGGSKISLTGGTTYTVSATVTKSGLDLAIDRDVSITNVSNTTTETTVYSFSVPANTLETNRALRLTMAADYLNNSAGSDTFTIRVKYGATTIFQSAQSLTQDANRRGLTLDVMLSAANGTGQQVARGVFVIGPVNTFAGNTQGNVGSIDEAIHASIAEDSTGALTLEVTFEHATAAATIDAREHITMLELL